MNLAKPLITRIAICRCITMAFFEIIAFIHLYTKPLNSDINIGIKARFQLENVAYTVYTKVNADKDTKTCNFAYFFVIMCR